ncbi:MAG: hypothetical protein JSV88_25665 [Candidatus Aminicenantes bacterium]|nr:MAG: hypothetical protein JSV88_25665 [Candidatus Aminicenantes bacterium]
MIDKVNIYFMVGACFLVVFLGAVALQEKYNRVIQSFFATYILFPMKVSRDDLITIFSLWFYMLFSRKMIYYVPFVGVIQTGVSVWWVDGNVLIFLYYIFILFLLGAAVIGYFVSGTKPVKYERYVGILIFFLLLGISFMMSVSNGLNISLKFDKGLLLIIFTPLLLLKMCCSGKYLGLLTAFLLGVLITHTWKKLKPKITRNNAKSLILPLFLLIAFGVFSFFQFTGNPGEKFKGKVQAANSQQAVEDLLEAAHTINDEPFRVNALKAITGKIVETGDLQWKRKMFLRVIEAAKTIYPIKKRYKVIKDIAVAIARSGDIQWATSVAKGIPYAEIRNSALKGIRDIREKWRKND